MPRVYQFDNPHLPDQKVRRSSLPMPAEAIIQGHLTPGAEAPFARSSWPVTFSVSRIPLREALRRLESEG